MLKAARNWYSRITSTTAPDNNNKSTAATKVAPAKLVPDTKTGEKVAPSLPESAADTVVYAEKVEEDDNNAATRSVDGDRLPNRQMVTQPSLVRVQSRSDLFVGG